MEIEVLSDGGYKVPYRETFGSDSARLQFRDMWFKNKRESNYVWVCGASYHDYVQDAIAGANDSDYNCTYVYVQMIEDAYGSGDRATVNADTTVHELGHLWALTDVDDDHPNVSCHEGSGTDKCVMDQDADRTDDYSQFCYDNPNHLMDIRDAADDL